MDTGKLLLSAGAAGAVGMMLAVPELRRKTLTKGLMTGLKRAGVLPRISQTEKTAIEAGTVWVDGDLFSGHPDFRKLLDSAYPDLTEEERAFVDGPVDEVCSMVSDWEIWQRRDLPPDVWEFLREHRFFGMIIPKEYGGLGFSASANSAVVAKLGAHSMVLGITVMVPNSLGPAELLIHYGTSEQRDHYLPRLARGEEIPAFALTEPNAGSDAGAISSSGVVFRGDDGNLFLRLNWKKRYITLGAVATVLGLAFKLRDPEHLLGDEEDLGITCALVPTHLHGVENDLRHDPMGVPFVNSPTEGHDVVVPIDAIIGGKEGAGKGWRMLMESLAAGRGISLPATATGGAKMAYRVAGAHAAVRKQFGLSIGKFEGIEEPLARIGGFTYIMEAARRYTNGGLDAGAKPAVVTALMKYNTTEMSRQVVNDAMDILAGNAISRGPRNNLAHVYTGTPIAITVEGANILTRTLMVFGQGAIRCHPYVYREVTALQDGDLVAFDEAFWSHMAHVVSVKLRAGVLSATRGRFASSPVNGPAAPYYQKLAWASASFAFLAEIALGSMGGALKRREKLTGRFADIFSWMYLANAVLVRFEKEGRLEEDLPFFRWSMEYALKRMQDGFDGIYKNIDVPLIGSIFRGPIALWSRMSPLGTGPSDELGHQVAGAMQVPGAQRDRHTAGLYVSDDPQDALGRLEHALRLHHAAQSIERRIKDAVRKGHLPKGRPEQLVAQAVAKGVISETEAGRIEAAEAARNEVVQVDAYDMEAYLKAAAHPDARTGLEPTQVAPQERDDASIIGTV